MKKRTACDKALKAVHQMQSFRLFSSRHMCENANGMSTTVSFAEFRSISHDLDNPRHRRLPDSNGFQHRDQWTSASTLLRDGHDAHNSHPNRAVQQ